jgi:hypothetical protein
MPMAKGGTEHRSNITAQRYRSIVGQGRQRNGNSLGGLVRGSAAGAWLIRAAGYSIIRTQRTLLAIWKDAPDVA